LGIEGVIARCAKDCNFRDETSPCEAVSSQPRQKLLTAEDAEIAEKIGLLFFLLYTKAFFSAASAFSAVRDFLPDS
jgi:hypothetical protein